MEQTEKIINETGQDGEQFVKTFLKAENIRRSEQRGGKTFEGNQAMKLLSKAGNLMDYIGVQMEDVQKKISDISKTLEKFKVVVDQCFVSSSFQDTYMQLKSSIPATGCCTTSLSLQSIILLRLISSNILTEEAMVQKVLVTGQSRLWKVVIMTSKSFGPTQKLIKITLTLLKGSLVPLLNTIALISR